MWNMRPGAAQTYFRGIVRDFERYARDHYVPALTDPQADDMRVLAALRYVETREVQGHEAELKELLTVRRGGAIGKRIGQAGVDALLNTSTSTESAARFLVSVRTMRNPPLKPALCEDGLRRLGAPALNVLLNEILTTQDGLHRKKLALLLVRISKVGMPEPQRFWQRADSEELRQAVRSWRQRIVELGRLPATVQGDGNSQESDDAPEDRADGSGKGTNQDGS